MIKNILKQSGITQSQFAMDLNISRPTLDTYIELYDSGNKINNPFYHDIFDFLFENPYISESDFIKRYTYMRDFYGMSNSESTVTVSRLKSTFDVPKTEYIRTIESVERILLSDKNTPKTSLDNYKLVVNILHTNDRFIAEMYYFYAYLYGFEKLGNVIDEKTKRLYTNFYNALLNTNDINQQVDNKMFDEYCIACEEAYQNKHGKIDKIMRTINERITTALEEELTKSELEKIDMNEVISIIKKKI